jgi:hypothetical protein
MSYQGEGMGRSIKAFLNHFSDYLVKVRKVFITKGLFFIKNLGKRRFQKTKISV